MLLEAELLSPALVLAPSEEASQTETALRIATYAYASDTLDTPASTIWFPRIVGPVSIEQGAMSSIGLGGVVAYTAGDLVVADQDGWATDLARYSGADGRSVELRVVPVTSPRASDFGTPLRSAPVVWRGIVRRVDRGTNRRARIALDDLTIRLQTPLQASRYTGAGGLNGPASLADRPKPLAIGQLFNVQPIDLGLVDLGDGALPTYQSHWRAVLAHDAVRIRGVSQTAVMSAPGVSQFRDWPALGVFQLGSTPDGAVTCDVRGDSDGYPNTTGSILWRLISLHGPQFTEADRYSDAWSFAETDLGGTIGFYQPAQDVTALQACQAILAGCGGVLCGARDGRLRLFDPMASVSDMQFDLAPTDLVAEPVPVPLPAALSPAAREVQVEWGRNYTPLSDIGTAAPAALRQRLGDAAPPVASVSSASITARVLTQRTLRLPGLYADISGAQSRAAVISAWLEGGGQAWTVTTDRYLGVVDLGDWGRVTYPVAGMNAGFRGVVVALREDFDRRRVTLTMLGSGG
jgi:hypothetical protein